MGSTWRCLGGHRVQWWKVLGRSDRQHKFRRQYGPSHGPSLPNRLLANAYIYRLFRCPRWGCGAGGNRTPVHKSYATRSTYVATSIVLTARYPTGRESKQPARYFFVEHTPDTCALLSDERYT